MTSLISADGPLPYVAYCGVEIGNAARTLSYLRRGLGDTTQGKWELAGGDVCGALYRDDNGVTQVFTSPAADPAPWYDASEPGSTAFLGVVLLDLKGYDGVSTRAITPQQSGLGGGAVGRKIRKPREWKFRAALISSNGAGAEYGLRWLKDQLEGGQCVDCATTCDMRVRLLCPPSDGSNDDLGLWLTYDTFLTEGPIEVEPWIDRKSKIDADILAGCRDYVIVEWTMTSANPWLFRPPVLLSSFQLGAGGGNCTDICSFLSSVLGNNQCVNVTPPNKGVLGTVFMFRSESGSSDFYLESWESCGGLCCVPQQIDTHLMRSSRNLGRPSPYRRRGIPTITPDRIQVMAPHRRPSHPASTSLGGPQVVSPPPPIASMHISGVPAGTTLVIDSAQRKITLIDNVTGERDDGTSLLVFNADNAIPWMEVRDCDAIGCFCIRSSTPCVRGDLFVTAYAQERET